MLETLKSHLVELIMPTGTVGIEGWDTVNLAKWDVLPPKPPSKKNKKNNIPNHDCEGEDDKC